MNDKDWKLWSNITFKTQSYRKNFDFIYENENIITEYEGSTYNIKIDEFRPPMIIGEYGFSVWNIELGSMIGVDFNKLINEHKIENTYAELLDMIKKNEIDVSNYKKIVFLHTFILRKEYRKCGITDELIEMFYRDFYNKNTAIFALIKPFQYNPIDADFFYKRKTVQIKENVRSSETFDVPAYEYYSLNELKEKTDRELNEYKLFAIANRCGFSRIDNSYLFKYSPKKTIARIMEKCEFTKINENSNI
jgi:hypothetical protein